MRAAERELWDIETAPTRGDDRRWRRSVLAPIPDEFALNLARIYRRTFEQTGSIADANEWLRETAGDLQARKRKLAASDYDLIQCAERRAEQCRKIRP